jgi:hypothetical protein
MHLTDKRIISLLTCFVLIALLSGCTDWKKKYQALSVEHENLRGLLERERTGFLRTSRPSKSFKGRLKRIVRPRRRRLVSVRVTMLL